MGPSYCRWLVIQKAQPRAAFYNPEDRADHNRAGDVSVFAGCLRLRERPASGLRLQQNYKL